MTMATMVSLICWLLIASQATLVLAVPGNLNCDGTQWVPGNPFPDPGGDMGNIPIYTTPAADDCLILGLPSQIEFCAEYTITLTSKLPMGHKISSSDGYLNGHPDFLTDGQNDRCRHQYSQTETKYVYRASTQPGDGQHKFYALCGGFNGPMDARVVSVPNTNPQGRTSCNNVQCFAPLNSTERACFPPTSAPTPEPPGSAVNDIGKGAASNSMLSATIALVTLMSFFLVLFS